MRFLQDGPMHAGSGSSRFGTILRQYRSQAGLSQDALAERANLSTAAIGALERGTRRAPHRATVGLIADALALGSSARAALESAAERARAHSVIREPTEGRTQNLPTQLTSLVGREDEVAELLALLEKRRLVTVTGSGGVGKTRVALETASRFPMEQCDELWFVDLAPVRDGALIVDKFASVLGIRCEGRAPSLVSLAREIKDRKCLIVLDNCEQLIAAAAAVAKGVLEICPRVKILATSRERFGIASEVVYRLPSLATPDESRTAAETRSYPAVELFIERAMFAEPRFVPTERLLRIVADICRLLDGIPLAIELAAAQVPVFGLGALRARLREHASLVGVARDLPLRQRTILATTEWSYDLLDEREQRLLRRIAIFAGGFNLEAAEAACSCEDLARTVVADVLYSLVEKSLVSVVIERESTWYRMLETIRSFGLQKLAEAGEAALLARRHAAWFASFADRVDSMVSDVPRIPWLKIVSPELDNVRAALDWSLKSPAEDDAALGGRIVCGLRRLWISLGLMDECRRWTESALAKIDDIRHPIVTGRLLLLFLESTTGTTNDAAFDRAYRHFERNSDRLGLASTHLSQAMTFFYQGGYERAERSITLASSVLTDGGFADSALRARILNARAWIFCAQSRLDEAHADVAALMVLAERAGDDILLFVARRALAAAAFVAGDIRRAETIMEHEIQRLAAIGGTSTASIHYITEALCDVATFRLMLNDVDGAAAAAREAIRRPWKRFVRSTLWALSLLTAVHAAAGHVELAARLLGSIRKHYAERGFRPLYEQSVYDALEASLRAQLSDDTIAKCAAEGTALGLDEAMEEALARSESACVRARR